MASNGEKQQTDLFLAGISFIVLGAMAIFFSFGEDVSGNLLQAAYLGNVSSLHTTVSPVSLSPTSAGQPTTQIPTLNAVSVKDQDRKSVV